MADGFNERKAAHVSAFFVLKAGGSINVLKLMTLIYLSDREFLSRYDAPILYDRLVSMSKGPLNSNTYNCASGQVEATIWNGYLSDAANHMIELKQAVTPEDLDELSRAEIAVLEDVWKQFGHMSQWQLVDHTHDNCAEWEDPAYSSSTIPYERVLKALGKGTSAREIAERIEAERTLLSRFSEHADITHAFPAARRYGG